MGRIAIPQSAESNGFRYSRVSLLQPCRPRGCTQVWPRCPYALTRAPELHQVLLTSLTAVVALLAVHVPPTTLRRAQCARPVAAEWPHDFVEDTSVAVSSMRTISKATTSSCGSGPRGDRRVAVKRCGRIRAAAVRGAARIIGVASRDSIEQMEAFVADTGVDTFPTSPTSTVMSGSSTASAANRRSSSSTTTARSTPVSVARRNGLTERVEQLLAS